MRTHAKIEHGVRCCSSRNVLKCHGCPYGGLSFCREQLLKDVQDYLKAIRKCSGRIEQHVKQLEAAQPKWISVEERLPGKPCDVLAVVNGHVMYTWYHPRTRCFENGAGICYFVTENMVTHWMPLPNPPKEDVC